MKRWTNEEELVDKLLSEYSIRERNDDREFNALVATLVNGEKRLIDLEKTIVPANVIDRYYVVEMSLPGAGWLSSGTNNVPIALADSYAESKVVYEDRAAMLITNKIEDWKVQLVGQFKGQVLEVDQRGITDANTGITLCSMVTTKNQEIEKIYIDPDLPMKFTNRVYVEFNRKSNCLKFEQRLFSNRELNLEFWKVEQGKNPDLKLGPGGGKDKGDLLHKRNAADWSAERWVNSDSLLSKRSGGNTHGKGMP